MGLTTRATAPNGSCFTGGFYRAPANGATVDALKPLALEWDPTCLDTVAVDVYVLTPGAHALAPHIWNDVPFALGSYSLQLQPRWWNATATQSVQLAIVPAGSPLGLNALPAGPVITATYTPPADGNIPDIANPNAPDTNPAADLKGGTSKSLAPGKTAAAVLLPLLLVLALIFAYLRFQRKRTLQKSKRFSQALDKRMSTINPDWSSVSAAGATAAIRSSMAVADRSSTAFAFGNIRPASMASNMAMEDTNTAGVGTQKMTQIRTGTGVGLRNPAQAAAIAAERASRVSRVSFAQNDHPRTSIATSRVSFADTRPSIDSSRRTRAFHQGHVPPVPLMRADVVSAAMSVYPDSEIDPNEKRSVPTNGSSPTLSPRQTTGPLTLTPEDIRARMEGRQEEKGAEMDEVMPALSMMRTGLEPPTPTTHSFALAMSESDSTLGPTTVDIADAYPQDYLLPASPPPAYPKSSSTSMFSASNTVFSSSPSMASTTSTYVPSPTNSAFFPSQPATGPMMMSPDDMLRAYAGRQSATATPPPPPPPPAAYSGSPKVKGRKLSLRASFAGKKDRNGGVEGRKAVIGHPVLIDARSGEQHVIGEDEDEQGGVRGHSGEAYVGMGMAN